MRHFTIFDTKTGEVISHFSCSHDIVPETQLSPGQGVVEGHMGKEWKGNGQYLTANLDKSPPLR